MVTRKGTCHVPKDICFFGHETKYLDYQDLKIAAIIAFFIDHEKDVFICSISTDNGQIVS